jgi:hypothetical protein
MIAIFCDHRANHHAIACQAFLHDARLAFWHGHRRALSASPLLAFDDPHEPTRRFMIQLRTLVVSNDSGLFTALAAMRFCAPNHLFYPRQRIR